ncbi:hypothetical protein AOY38_01335 [Synechocystis sp. PCC 6803]|nr:hypothetical protein AOY38_01335 [Synechocystis sp. PCC 6803]
MFNIWRNPNLIFEKRFNVSFGQSVFLAFLFVAFIPLKPINFWIHAPSLTNVCTIGNTLLIFSPLMQA